MRIVTKSLMIALCGVLMSGAVSANGTAPLTQTRVDNPQDAAKKAPFQVGMYRVINSLKMNVLIEKQLGERVVVKLLDQKGVVLFEDVLGRRQQKYGRKLDFSEIKDGNYTVVVTNGTEEIVKDIRLSTLALYEMPARTLVAVN
ncbi:hypothetical protein [Telluribacter sp. SYSU D00476]|uniref:hypothetical protein n=1 Tax=Telluribacter sp. SYSU D00476 TaxID=2811430 RepID=UPI001FF3D0FA|nr:hypothetical protein [Telluribacter sp. SYSU D00476]